MEHKQTEVAITAVDEAQGIVEAVWAVMGNVDEVGDIIHPGAFTKTFNERGNQIKLLDNHRTDSVMASLGLVKELREVKRAELPQSMMDSYPDVTGGAWGRFQFLLDTPEGKGAFARIKSGAVDKWSFGYDAVDKDYSQKDGKAVRNLRGIKLYEVSPVLFPANSATATTDAKSVPNEDEAAAQAEAPEGKSAKEMTEHGPMRRLGDVLQGSIHKIFTLMCDEWYTQGFMSRDERIALSSLIGDALDILASGIPEDLAMRPLQSHEMYYMSFTPNSEIKAGRVLNARMGKRIMDAMALLHEALKEAGLMETPEDDDPSASSGHNKPTGPQKSDNEPPTSDAKEAGSNEDERTRLLKLVELQNDALKLLEV